MDDLISRQAAIDALEKEYRCTDQSDDWDGLKTAMLIIENLPSSHPETNCSEIPNSCRPHSLNCGEEKNHDYRWLPTRMYRASTI